LAHLKLLAVAGVARPPNYVQDVTNRLGWQRFVRELTDGSKTSAEGLRSRGRVSLALA
jgi:hypothetical protein